MQINVEVRNLVGMKKAQEEFENLRQIVGHVIKTGDREPLGKCLNLVLCQASIGGMYEVSLGFVHWQVLTGAPGTGKTTFARLLYRFMHAHGILPSKSEKFIGVPSFWVDHSFFE
jgi:hypothetical protein